MYPGVNQDVREDPELDNSEFHILTLQALNALLKVAHEDKT